MKSDVLLFLCRLFLALTQFAFVIGAVYFKYSIRPGNLHVINPVVFAFFREVVAGFILSALACVLTRSVPKKEDFKKLMFLGLLVYFNQLCYIMGVELSGVVVATCIQPAIPVFTAAFAIGLGKEDPSYHKLIGILFASVGALCMVAGGGDFQSQANSNVLIGNLFLFCFVVIGAVYYIYIKQILLIYPPIAAAAWGYMSAAVMMGITAMFYNRHYQEHWNLPSEAVGPLIYWILVCSVGGYCSITWAAKYLPSTQVAAFTCLQPPIGSLLGFAILGESLSVWDFGAFGVIVGLLLVNRESKPLLEKPKPAAIPKIEVHKTPMFFKDTTSKQ